jgi:hypothetical protein
VLNVHEPLRLFVRLGQLVRFRCSHQELSGLDPNEFQCLATDNSKRKLIRVDLRRYSQGAKQQADGMEQSL